MTWYDEFFEGDWLYVQRNLHSPERSEEEANALIELLELSPGDELLDVPCGTGRISIPMARRGIHVTGVDMTEALLDDARAAGEGLPVTWHLGDMRHLPWSGRFDVALNFWGSFGYFDDAGNAAFAAEVCNALRPGGRFVIEVPATETMAARYQRHMWTPVGEVTLLEERVWHPVSGRVEQTWTFLRDGHTTTRHSSIRFYSCPELCNLLRGAGFTSFDPRGGVDGRPYGMGPIVPRLLMVATRP